MATDLLTMVAAGSQSMQLQAACAANHDDNHVDGDDGGGHAVDADPSCVTHQPRWRQAFSQSTQLRAACAANHDDNHIDGDDSGGHAADADPSCVTCQPRQRQAVGQRRSKPRTPPTTTTTATTMTGQQLRQ